MHRGFAEAHFISIHLMFILIYRRRAMRLTLKTISIHLMFILICTGGHQPPAFTDFNTSHVYINQGLRLLGRTFCRYFNTSHVYINHRFLVL